MSDDSLFLALQMSEHEYECLYGAGGSHSSPALSRTHLQEIMGSRILLFVAYPGVKFSDS